MEDVEVYRLWEMSIVPNGILLTIGNDGIEEPGVEVVLVSDIDGDVFITWEGIDYPVKSFGYARMRLCVLI